MLAAILLASVLVYLRFAPPAPRGADAPADQFSGERAHALLAEVIGQAPHPTGSRESSAVRERIVAELTSLGYAPEQQAHVACGGFGQCMRITNVLAKLEAGDDVVLVAAHYDSVPAGPGISDDGVGVVALLEVARAIRELKPTNTIALLFTDAEEMGLHGAAHFMNSRFARRVKAVINVDNRGTSGPSLMFETAGPTAALAPLLSELERPTTSSLFSGVYEQLPNDTDFTRFRARGAVGFNFAIIGDVAHYHTDRDDLEHVSKASIQHHGDNVLALTRALSVLDLETLKQGERAVFFDWLGLFVVHWDEMFAVPLALFALLMLGGAVAGRRRQKRWWMEVLKGTGYATAILVGSVVTGGLLALALYQLRAGPLPLHAALVIPGTAVLCATAALVLHCGPSASKKSFWLRYGGLNVPVVLAALAISDQFAAASHLFVVPALASGLACAIGSERRSKGGERLILITLPVFVTATLWIRVALGIAAAVNVAALPIIGLAFALVAAPAVLVLPERPGRMRSMTAIGVVVYAAVTLVYPAHTASFPQRQSIVEIAVDDEPAEIWVDTTWGPPSAALNAVLPFAGDQPPALPVIGMSRVAVAKSAPVSGELPRVEVRKQNGQTREVVLSSGRDADAIGLLVPAQMGVKFEGRTVRKHVIGPPSRFAGMRFVLIRGATGADDPEVVLSLLTAEAHPEVYVFDIVRRLHAKAAEVAAARGATGVPSQEGDLSIRVRAHRL